MPIVNKNERKRYKDKIGRLQYIRDTKVQINSDTVASNDTANVTNNPRVLNNEVSDVAERIALIENQYKDLKERFESFVNGEGIQVNETGIVVYNTPVDETVLRERKGFFGKSKWVEEKV